MLTDLMSPAMLSSHKEINPTGPAKDPGRTSPMGGKAFENTLRQILSPDGGKTAEKTIDTTASDDELGKKTPSGRAQGDEALSLAYLAYIQSLGLNTADGLEPGGPAEGEISPNEAVMDIPWALGELLGTESSTAAVFQDGMPVDLGIEENGLGVSTSVQEVDASAVAAQAGQFQEPIPVSSAAMPDTQWVQVAGGNAGRNPIPGGLGENPLGTEESVVGSKAVVDPTLIRPDEEAAPGTGQMLQRTQPGLWGPKGARRTARLSLNGEKTASLAKLQEEVLADRLRSGASTVENPAALSSVEDLQADDRTAVDGMELVEQVLAMAKNPVNAAEAALGSSRVQNVLENGTESFIASETKAVAAAVEGPDRFLNPEVDSPVSPQGAGEYPGAAFNPSIDQSAGPVQGLTVAFIQEPGDLAGYETVMEGLGEGITAGELDGDRVDAENGRARSRGILSSLRWEGGLEHLHASPSTDPAASFESLSGITPGADVEDGLQSEIPSGSEIKAGTEEADSRGESSQRISGQEIQDTSRFGSFGEQVSQTGASLSSGTQQPAEASGLKPQHPAPGTPVNPRRVVEQIVRGVELNVKGENGEIRLQLKPDSLGEVEVRIATNNGLVSAAFVAESQRVKSLIEAGLPQLKQQLMEQGLNIQGFSVEVGGGSTYGRDPYPRGLEAGGPGPWWQRGSGLVQGAIGSTQARRHRWGSTIDYRV
ncbi:MAG: flagellar hook-length control protein FliK [Firmicutes bacterium]|nr:flagellar hook-length control protein FliK [Bacillota bacterium]